MAAKLVVALACFALCSGSPAFMNGYIFRNGRGYSIGQGYTNSVGGRATGSATSNGGVMQAYGTAVADEHAQLRNVYGLPGEVVAKAEVYDGPGPSGASKAVANAHNTPTYYTVPAPATIISYQQNFETPEFPGAVAQSSAVLNGNADQSAAKTQGVGTYGITSSNTKTFGSGYGTASSNVNNDYGVANTVANTRGLGSAVSKSETGLGLTSAATNTQGGYASSSANNALNHAVVSASSEGIASSKADINGGFVAPIKVSDRKSIGWRFGTAYTVPTPGHAQVASQANGGSAKSTAHADGVLTTSDAQGFGSANANANLYGAQVNSAANTNGLSLGKYVEGNGYGSAHSTVNNGLGNIKSSANTNGYGNANSHADISMYGSLVSTSNSNGKGTAASSANTGSSYIRGVPYSPQSVNTQTSGQGSASAKTQGLNSGYKVVNSVANSFANGAAQANARA